MYEDSYGEQVALTRAGVVANPYQGQDKRVLFVCSAGILRSATAARIYAKKYNTRCCGSEDYALIPLSPLLIKWADEIVFVNQENYDNYVKRNPEAFNGAETIKILNIPDFFQHMAPELIEQFRIQYGEIE